jgi:TolB-like protein
VDRPFSAYTGDEPYIFVSYSHQDSDVVFPRIQWLRDQGFNIWYDEGISPGASWREELAESILGCDLFIILVSPQSAQSDNCLKEVNYALEHDRPVLAIHQEPTQLSPGLELALSDRQAIFRYELTQDQYQEKVLSGVMSHIPQGQSTNVIPQSPSTRRSSRSILTVGVLIAMATLAVGILLYMKLSEEVAGTPGTSRNSVKEREFAQQNLAEPSVVAILPFNNLSSDKEYDYLAEGMTEDIITLLSQSRLVEVIARSSTFQYKGVSPDLRQVGEELGAHYIVEGSVRQLASRVRVTAQLIDSQTGTHVWADKYDVPLADIFNVQDDITMNIAGALGEAIVMEVGTRVSQIRPENLTVWQLTARADHLMSGELSVQNAEKAIELDPNYALAHAVLGRSFAIMGSLQAESIDPESDIIRSAEWHARRALQLGQNDPKVLAYAGITLLWTGHPEEALLLLKTSNEISPSYVQGLIYYADVLIHNGRGEEALPLAEKAIRLTPRARELGLYKIIKYEALIQTGALNEAALLLTEIAPLADIHTVWFYLALAQVLLDQNELALQSLRRVYSAQPSFRVSYERDRMNFYDAHDGGEYFIRGWALLEPLEKSILKMN